MDRAYFRYGWEGAYMVAKKLGYRRSYSGFLYAAKRMGFCGGKGKKKTPRKQDRRYPELSVPGEKVQIDVKEVPYNCLRGKSVRTASIYISGQQLTSVPEYGLYMP